MLRLSERKLKNNRMNPQQSHKVAAEKKIKSIKKKLRKMLALRRGRSQDKKC